MSKRAMMFFIAGVYALMGLGIGSAALREGLPRALWISGASFGFAGLFAVVGWRAGREERENGHDQER